MVNKQQAANFRFLSVNLVVYDVNLLHMHHLMYEHFSKPLKTNTTVQHRSTRRDKYYSIRLYCHAVRDVEQRAGLDFFRTLPDDVEARVEGTVDGALVQELLGK